MDEYSTTDHSVILTKQQAEGAENSKTNSATVAQKGTIVFMRISARLVFFM